jgi:hypothetical protein
MDIPIQTESDRVRRHTRPEQLRRIDQRTEELLQLYISQPPEVIERRIAELRREWSIERYLQLNTTTLGVAGVALAAASDRRWGLFTCTVLAALVAHAQLGLHPALPFLRQLGIRTRPEIDRELYALKALRGDFDGIDPVEPRPEDPRIERAIAAVGL